MYVRRRTERRRGEEERMRAYMTFLPQDTARNKSCARDKEGGWWFHACYAAHPNGVYPDNPQR